MEESSLGQTAPPAPDGVPDADRFRRVQELFAAARGVAADRRPRLLDERCVGIGGEAVRAEVESLLAHVEASEGMLGEPALGGGFHVREALTAGGDAGGKGRSRLPV